MKKYVTLALAVLMAFTTLTGCGASSDTAATPSVTLQEFYDGLAEEYGWDDMTMAVIDPDIQATFYPGIENVDTVEVIARAPMMSAVVSELVLAECTDEEAATALVAILEERMSTQALGGAWYPSSMEAWGNAHVMQQGNYVALIASEEHQAEIVAKWDALFA
ncbi:DUF4358 domain-containing protein [Bengtsoniella intestinalis]|uniref:DUF4358 domain-containing protein n=1 Tax=Bengtsoniella intestinalis TaxID=3073143 RepID=UPI00391F8405